MRPFEERVRAVVRKWLIKADADLEAAVLLARNPDSVREVIAFHCQQAVEKYIAAVLVFRQIEFEKTHDIKKLLGLVGSFDDQLAAALADTASLTVYAVQTCYPNDLAEVLPGREFELLAIAERTRKLVLEGLENNA